MMTSPPPSFILPVALTLLSASFLQSKGSLEVTESQSADAEPPPPPKPDLSRYTGLRTHLSLATNEGECGRSEITAEMARARGGRCVVTEKTQQAVLGPLLRTVGGGSTERGP